MAGGGSKRPVPREVFRPKIIWGYPEGWESISVDEILSSDTHQQVLVKLNKNINLYEQAVNEGMYARGPLSQMEVDIDTVFTSMQAKLGDTAFRMSPFQGLLKIYNKYEIPIEQRL